MTRGLTVGKQLLVVAALFAALFIGAVLYRSLVIGREARSELLNVYGKLRPGLSVSEVDQVFSTNRYSRLKMVNVSPELVLIRSPLEWNANNWLLWMDVTNGQIYQLRIRLEDDAQLKPADAPPDKLADARR